MVNPERSLSKPNRSNLRLSREMLWQHRLVVPGLILMTLLLGLLAWRFNFISDHTNNHRNTLSAASIQVLKALPGAIEITAFSSNSPYKGRYFRKSIQSLVQRYQLLHSGIHLQFIDPASAPRLAREQQVKKEGEMIIRYRGQQKRMYLPYTEEALTNVLLQLQHGERAPLLFASGQGETALDNPAASGASRLAEAMREAGLQFSSNADFASIASHDKKTPTLVLAAASQSYSRQQAEAIQSHINKGGNLIWLVENATSQGLETLATTLGLNISPGMVIDPANRQFDIPLHAISTQRYSGLGPTQDFALRTFFDQAHALLRERQPTDTWRTLPLTAAAERGWASAAYRTQDTETLPAFNPHTDIQGPATIALALEKTLATGEFQRILVIGSAGFFTNAQQQRGGNQAFTMQSVQWVVNNQPTITLPVSPLRDSVVLLPTQQTWLMLLFNGFQFGLPALLLAAGWLAWRRKHRH